jgi:beta-galactosidase
MPHELVIDLGREVTLAGLSYLPRQDMANGRIAECDVLADGNVVAQVKWPNTAELQTVRFKAPVKARQLTLRIKSEVNGNPFAAVAELDALLE